MKRLTMGLVISAMLFLGLQTVANATQTPAPTSGLPNACKGKVPYDHYDNVVNGTSGSDTIIIAAIGSGAPVASAGAIIVAVNPNSTTFVNAMGGNDTIIVKGSTRTNCLWGGSGDDRILGSLSLLDICVTGGSANDQAAICRTIVP